MAYPRVEPGSRCTAASPAPGPRTVRFPTVWSYCSYSQDRSAMPGVARRVRSVPSWSSEPSTTTLDGGSGRDAAGHRRVGAPSATRAAGRSTTVSPRWITRIRPVSVTVPQAAAWTPCERKWVNASSTRSGSTTSMKRSCDSERSTSNASMPGSRVGTASRSTSSPVPAAAAISDVAHAMPHAPRSWHATGSKESIASISFLPMNGSPTCTWDRRVACSSCSPSSSEANAAPRIPSRPVVAPTIRRMFPGPAAAALRISPRRTSPAARAFTNGFPSYRSSNDVSPPTLGTPYELP